MIKSNELRIGNIVCYARQILIVEEIGSRGTLRDGKRVVLFKNDKLMAMVDDLKPIELTPEILEKAGFEEDNPKTGNFYLNNEEIKRRMCVSLYDNTQKKVWLNQHYLGVLHLQYLHQLQNLYFSLTGNELEIKP